MIDTRRISKKQIVFLLLGISTAAFLGIVAGSYVVQQKTARASKLGANLLLKVGQIFPHYRFVGADARFPDFDPSVDGKKSVLFFLTTDCGFCNEAIGRWANAYSKFKSKYQVVGISYEKMDVLKEYQVKKKVPFPLFNDSLGKFTAEYKIDAYPTLIGINEKREIVFIEFGNRPKKAIEDYLRSL